VSLLPCPGRSSRATAQHLCHVQQLQPPSPAACCKLTASLLLLLLPCPPACSDVAWDYQGSCGKCKEVKCKRTGLKDGYGAWLDRHVCYNDYASVVVTVTDTVRVCAAAAAVCQGAARCCSAGTTTDSVVCDCTVSTAHAGSKQPRK
jgi:hypothetical protein